MSEVSLWFIEAGCGYGFELQGLAVEWVAPVSASSIVILGPERTRSSYLPPSGLWTRRLRFCW